MSDALHPYDGQERRYRHTDADADVLARGRAEVARLLDLPEPPPAEGLCYDLSFYSGGIGVLDRLSVSMECEAPQVDAIVQGQGLVTPEQALADPEWGEDFEWLVRDERQPAQTLAEAVAAFVDQERPEWLPPLADPTRAWFARNSDVNCWMVLYESDRGLCTMAYDQG